MALWKGSGAKEATADQVGALEGWESHRGWPIGPRGLLPWDLRQHQPLPGCLEAGSRERELTRHPAIEWPLSHGGFAVKSFGSF